MYNVHVKMLFIYCVNWTHNVQAELDGYLVHIFLDERTNFSV